MHSNCFFLGSAVWLITKDSFVEFPVRERVHWQGPLSSRHLFLSKTSPFMEIPSQTCLASRLVHKESLISYCCMPDQSTCSCHIPKRNSKFLSIRKKCFLFICKIREMPGATVIGGKKNKSRISHPVLFCWQDTRSANEWYLIVRS